MKKLKSCLRYMCKRKKGVTSFQIRENLSINLYSNRSILLNHNASITLAKCSFLIKTLLSTNGNNYTNK